MSLVKSIRRRRKARPGTTTEHAKLRRPINDCTSFKVAFLRCRNFERRALDLVILSAGKRASNNIVSNSIPASIKVVRGPTVFSGASLQVSATLVIW